MADTIRKKILDSAETDFKAETWIVSGGVDINPGKTNYKPADMPGISMFAGDEQGEETVGGMQDCLTQVEFHYIDLLSNHEGTAFDVIEDIRGKMINSIINFDLDGLAESSTYVGGSVEYPTIENETFKVSVLFEIFYRTLILNPYLQGDE